MWRAPWRGGVALYRSMASASGIMGAADLITWFACVCQFLLPGYSFALSPLFSGSKWPSLVYPARAGFSFIPGKGAYLCLTGTVSFLGTYLYLLNHVLLSVWTHVCLDYTLGCNLNWGYWFYCPRGPTSLGLAPVLLWCSSFLSYENVVFWCCRMPGS